MSISYIYIVIFEFLHPLFVFHIYFGSEWNQFNHRNASIQPVSRVSEVIPNHQIFIQFIVISVLTLFIVKIYTINWLSLYWSEIQNFTFCNLTVFIWNYWSQIFNTRCPIIDTVSWKTIKQKLILIKIFSIFNKEDTSRAKSRKIFQIMIVASMTDYYIEYARTMNILIYLTIWVVGNHTHTITLQYIIFPVFNRNNNVESLL